MISIDRSSSIPIQDQLASQLKYRIASGHFKVGEVLPSTRALAEKLGISFHTVRKAYVKLERNGLIESHAGIGFTVAKRVPLSKSAQMELGAATIQEMLQRLIGLGLEEQEIESLLHEQIELLNDSREQHKFLFTGDPKEIADLCAEQISKSLQQPVESTLLGQLYQHPDADYIFCAYSNLREVIDQFPRTDVIGVTIYFSPEACERIARLLDHQTLGIVVRHQNTIPFLMSQIRETTGFSGQMLAASIEERPHQLDQIVTETDFFIFTPQTRRRLSTYLESNRPHTVFAPIVSKESLDALRRSVPS